MRWSRLLLVLLIPGCLDFLESAESAWDRPRCAEGAGPSGNAPLHALYAGSPEDVARRVASAFGDEIRGREAQSAGHSFESVRGHWWISFQPASIEFLGTGEAWLTDATTQEALDRLGLVGFQRVEDEHVPVTYYQKFDDSWIAQVQAASTPDSISDPPGYGTFTSVHVSDVRNLQDASASRDVDDARASAQEFLRCHPDWKSKTLQEEGVSFAVAWDSLAHELLYRYDTPESHCTTSFVAVHVDAVTGTVLDAEPQPCH